MLRSGGRGSVRFSSVGVLESCARGETSDPPIGGPVSLTGVHALRSSPQVVQNFEFGLPAMPQD